MKRVEMVRAGADQLLRAEAAIETAVVEVARLASDLGQMRMDAKMSMTVVPEAMGAVVGTLSTLANARTQIVEAHAHLDEVRNRMGCRTVAAGTLEDKGDARPAHSGLKVVGDERH